MSPQAATAVDPIAILHTTLRRLPAETDLDMDISAPSMLFLLGC